MTEVLNAIEKIYRDNEKNICFDLRIKPEFVKATNDRNTLNNAINTLSEEADQLESDPEALQLNQEEQNKLGIEMAKLDEEAAKKFIYARCGGDLYTNVRLYLEEKLNDEMEWEVSQIDRETREAHQVKPNLKDGSVITLFWKNASELYEAEEIVACIDYLTNVDGPIFEPLTAKNKERASILTNTTFVYLRT